MLSKSSKSARIVGRSGQSSETFGVLIDGPVGAKTFCTGLFLGSGEDVFVMVSDGCGDMFFMARAKKGSKVRSVEGDLGGIGDFGGG